MEFIEIITIGIEKNASDIHFIVNLPPVFRINGLLVKYGDNILSPENIENFAKQILNESQLKELKEKGEIDTSYSISKIGRFRVNVFKQRGNLSISLRIIPIKIPTMNELDLPSIVKDLVQIPRGLILITGPTGSGKTTTLASMINQINHEKSCHIITLEEPIEYVYEHQKSIINQREIGIDSLSFSSGLRAALRQDPDVILVGEMRDLETIKIVLTAAETGHLVLSSLHTLGVAKTVDRIVDAFSPEQRRQIRIQLSSVIQGIMSQQLLQSIDGKSRMAVFEIMIATKAIRNLIREGKNHQIDTAIQTGAKYGMQTMDNSILRLYKRKLISKETALSRAINKDILKKYL